MHIRFIRTILRKISSFCILHFFKFVIFLSLINGIVFVNKQSFSGRWCCLETITNLHPNIRFIPRKNVSLVSIINAKYIFIINQDIQIYMLPIAGQTAEPIGLNFFVDTQGFPGSVYG